MAGPPTILWLGVLLGILCNYWTIIEPRLCEPRLSVLESFNYRGIMHYLMDFQL